MKIKKKHQTDAMKLDRKDVEFTDHKTLQEEDEKYWAAASYEDKLETITYLRECFYGPEATTGRLQRFFEFTEQK